MRHALLPLLLLLAACQPQDPDGAAAPPPADAPPALEPVPTVSDFSRPMTARGTEPFWAVRIDGTKAVLLRPDHPEKAFEAPGAQISPGRAVYEMTAQDGTTMRVTLFVSICSDGMSDLTYPMTAEVELAGEALRGCAAPTDDLPREGG